jgi:predicted dehydrogenase
MIRMAIVGTGGMAHRHAEEYSRIEGVELVAACDVREDVAQAFAEKHRIPNVFTEVEALLDFGAFDAVSNVTPDRFHSVTTLPLLQAGKHVLCEKPLAENHADALRMAEAAQAAGVVHLVNFSYRNASAIHKAYELVQSGQLGTVMHVEASYLQSWLVSKAWGDWKTEDKWLWRLSTQHGSKGTLGDIGVHILDFATYPVGPIEELSCTLKTFPEVKGTQIGEYPLDANDSMVISARFANGALGTIHATRWATGHHNTVALRIFGSQGSLRINLDQSLTSLEWCTGENIDSGTWESLDCGATPNMYQRFITSIQTGVSDQPDFFRGAEIQKLLDDCERFA